MNDPDHLTIGALAKKVGISIDTIRFYEREELLTPTCRLASGYRQYDQSCVERIQFIIQAKDLGFSLSDIRELLTLQNERLLRTKSMRQSTAECLAELDQRIEHLLEIRASLVRMLAFYPDVEVPKAESAPSRQD